MTKPPKYLSGKQVVQACGYENMTNEERWEVFRAYEYDTKALKYTLKKPEELSGNTLRKLLFLTKETAQ